MAAAKACYYCRQCIETLYLFCQHAFECSCTYEFQDRLHPQSNLEMAEFPLRLQAGQVSEVANHGGSLCCCRALWPSYAGGGSHRQVPKPLDLHRGPGSP